MEKISLTAEKRKLTGRKVKLLRAEGILPANVYGKNIKSESIQVKSRDFETVYAKAGETGLVELLIGKEKKPVLVHNLQVNPLSDKPLHVDFLQVDLKQKVTAEVQVELVGEAPAEKQGLGTVVQHLNEIEVEALPMDLPEKFEVDTSGLAEIDQAVYVKDLNYDKAKVEVKADPEAIIVKVEEVKEEVVEAPAAPAEGEQAPAEGEVAAQPEDKPQEEK